MGDRRFRRALILICDHDEDHAMGIVLNRTMPKLTLPTLLNQLGIDCSIRLPKTAVLDGGPCQRDRGFVIHSDDWESDEATLPIASGIAMTATRDVLQAIAHGHKPARAALALGYSGWEAGQLESEICDNSWLVGDADLDAIFEGHDIKTKWEKAYSRLGLQPWQMSGNIGRA